MKKLLLTAALVSLTFSLAACYNTAPTETTTPAKPAGPISSQADCTAAGGKWEQVGLAGSLACVLKTKDAGKSCTDSSQCEERCLATADPVDDTNMIGQCQTSNQPFGCFAEMENGAPGPTLCID